MISDKWQLSLSNTRNDCQFTLAIAKVFKEYVLKSMYLYVEIESADAQRDPTRRTNVCGGKKVEDRKRRIFNNFNS